MTGGRFAAWATLCGAGHNFLGRAPEPHAAMLRGDWREAAEAFAAIGWSYDQALMLSLLRGFYNEDSDLGDYRIGPDTAGQPDPEPTVTPMTGAHLAAIRDFGLMFGKLREKRAFVQANRRRDDRDILRLFKKAVLPNVPDATFLTVFQQVVDTFDPAAVDVQHFDNRES